MQKLHTISTYNSLLSAKPQMMKLWQIISQARCYMINICESTAVRLFCDTFFQNINIKQIGMLIVQQCIVFLSLILMEAFLYTVHFLKQTELEWLNRQQLSKRSFI